MVAARSVAMAFNRVLDADIDAKNPRTDSRHLPAGILTRRFAWGFIVVSALVFLFAARELNPLCFKLAPLRWRWSCFIRSPSASPSLSHLVLGFSLGIAPAAAWIAMRGSLDPRILWLTAAVTLWTAGFDIIYACQDYDFDVARPACFSVPQRFGIAGALWIARVLHVGMIVCLLALVRLFALRLGSAVAGIAAVADCCFTSTAW